MNQETRKDLSTIAPLVIGSITAFALVASYIENKKHIRQQDEMNEHQKELTKLLIAEKKMQLDKNFRNFVAIKDVTSIMPNKKSTTAAWCTFYAEMKRRYGKETADVVFAKAWERRKSSSVATNDVVNCTGLALDTTWLQDAMSNANKAKEGILGGAKTLFNTGTTTYKIIVWGGAGLVLLLVGVGVYRLAKFKPTSGLSSLKTLIK